jgi:hypothetical protein
MDSGSEASRGGCRRRSADAELWRPLEPDVVRGPGTKSGGQPPHSVFPRAGDHPQLRKNPVDLG